MTHPSGQPGYEHGYGHGYGYGYPPPPPPPKPGVIPLAPMTFGQILTGAFSAFGRYWKPLLGVAGIAYAGATALVVGALLIGWSAVSDNVDRLSNLPHGQEPDVADIQGLFVAFGCAWLTGAVALVLANALVYAAVPVVAQEAVLGRPVGFGAVWRRAWSRLGAVLSSVLLSMLAMFVPALFFLVGGGVMLFGMVARLDASDGEHVAPDSGFVVAFLLLVLVGMATIPVGLWLWVKFALAPSVAVIEGAAAMASLRRSAALVRGSWWRIFGCMIAAGAMVAVASWAIQQVFSLLAWFPMATMPFDAEAAPTEVLTSMSVMLAVLLVGSIACQAVLAPFQPLVSTLLYVDQRIRKENLAPTLARAAGVA
ncbi:oxidoreductase [Streptomyces sp. NPDC048659]|uniref:oxidoreductase n=1 Tax=Streptomyces sp. NPDC048659 TaxID=3155489 RepID=UPI00341AE2C3